MQAHLSSFFGRFSAPTARFSRHGCKGVKTHDFCRFRDPGQPSRALTWSDVSGSVENLVVDRPGWPSDRPAAFKHVFWSIFGTHSLFFKPRLAARGTKPMMTGRPSMVKPVFSSIFGRFSMYSQPASQPASQPRRAFGFPNLLSTTWLPRPAGSYNTWFCVSREHVY